MAISRRQFIRNSGMLVAGAGMAQNTWPVFTGSKELVGVQLYSVRDDMKRDPLGTLEKIASMGYKHLEHANYIDRKFYGYAARDFRKLLDGLGLKMPSGHTVMRKDHWDPSRKDFTDSWKYTVEDAAVLGQQFVISPWLEESMRNSYDDMIRYMDIFNKSGELCRKSGMKFGYHNHDFEFSQQLNGQSVYDIILNHTDPDLVMQQLDIGNLYNGGAKAIDIVRKFPGRFEGMHVKDEILAASGHEKYESCLLGKGIVNVKEVIDLGRKSGGTIHFIVEQESYQGQAPLDAIRDDLTIMKNWGYQ